MKKLALFAILGMAVSLIFAAEPLTALQIMNKMDDVLYAPKDKDMKVRFTLIEKDGRESARDMVTLEKGADKRFMKFTAPADQKGIGFLSLLGEVMYIYLPAFGKTRRIASSVKNGKFAGTDLTYENLEPKRYAENWNPEIAQENDTCWVLKLLPKPGSKSDYSYIKVTVRKDNFYSVFISYFDKSGTECKTIARSRLEKIGKYWESRDMLVTDLKTGHKTRLELLDVKFDSNLSDDLFTERYLMR